MWRDHKADVLRNYLAIATGILPLLNFAFVALIEPEALARLVGWKITLKELALRMRFSRCGEEGG